MKLVLKKLMPLSSSGLLIVLSLGLHSIAISPQTSRAMDGMNHGANSSASCITICTSTTLHKDDYLSENEKKKDDEPSTPFYVQLQVSSLVALEKLHSQETRLAIEREPPPGGPPAYIALTVFRA